MRKISRQLLTAIFLGGTSFSLNAMDAPAKESSSIEINWENQESVLPSLQTKQDDAKAANFIGCISRQISKEYMNRFLTGFVTDAAENIENGLYNLALHSAEKGITVYNQIAGIVNSAKSLNELAARIATIDWSTKEKAGQPLKTFGRIMGESFAEAYVKGLGDKILFKLKEVLAETDEHTPETNSSWRSYLPGTGDLAETTGIMLYKKWVKAPIKTALESYGVKGASIKSKGSLYYSDPAYRLFYLDQFFGHLFQGVENLAHNLTVQFGEIVGAELLERLNGVITPYVVGRTFDKARKGTVDVSLAAVSGGLTTSVDLSIQVSARVLNWTTGSQIPLALLNPTRMVQNIVSEQLRPLRSATQSYATMILKPIASYTGAMAGAETAAYFVQNHIDGLGETYKTATLYAFKSFFQLNGALPEEVPTTLSTVWGWTYYGLTGTERKGTQKVLAETALSDAQFILESIENISDYSFMKGITQEKRESQLLKVRNRLASLLSWGNPSINMDGINFFEDL